MRALGLSLLLVVFAAALFWFFAAFVPRRRQAAIDGWRTALSVRADVRRSYLDRIIAKDLLDARMLAALPDARALLSGAVTAPQAEACRGRLSEILTLFVEVHGAYGVALQDAAGKRVVSAGEPSPAGSAVPASSPSASGGCRERVEFSRDESGRPLLAYVSPIVTRPHGEPTGCAVIAVNPEREVYPLLSAQVVPGETSEALLIQRGGDQILFLSHLRHRPDAPLTLRLPVGQANFAARLALEGMEDFGAFVDYRDVPVLAAVRRLKSAPWGLVVKVDEAEALAAFRKDALQRGITWGTLLLALSAAAVGFWRALVAANEVKVAQSEARSRALMEDVLDHSAALVYIVDTEGRFLLGNRALESVLGVPRGKILGQTRGVFMPRLDAAQQRRNDLEVIERRQSIAFEETNEKPDGLRVFSTVKFPLLDKQGNVYAVAGMSTDITERKQAEQALRESESRFRQLAESLPQLVWTCQPDGPCDYFNRQWIEFTGVPEARQFGFGWLEQLHPDDRAPTVAAWEAAVASGANFRVEFRIRRHDGEYRWFDTRAVRLLDAEGHTVKWYGSNTDLTERKRAEDEIRKLNAELEERVRQRTAQLEAANKELEAFSYSVSHDLRAPLRAVDGFSRILLEDHAPQLDAEGKRLLGVVRSNARQMGQLIDDLLSFSRIGRQEMARLPVDMAALARSAFDGLGASGDTISFTVGPLPAAEGDPSLMRQVWANLISNALKFTGPKAARTIEIEGRTEAGRVVYQVKDNGVGFDMAYSKKLFGVFQRLHSSAEFEGTGVGLALVQRIVHRHGGEVWAEGKVGEGATFSFSLPRPGGLS